MVEVRHNSEESEVVDSHDAFARLADASAKLFAEQAAAMAAMTAFGISVAGQMTGLMLGTFKPAETAPVREPNKTAGADGNVVPLRAKSERRDSVAETEPKAEEAIEIAPKAKVESKAALEESKPEAKAEVAKEDAQVKLTEVEAAKTAPKIEAAKVAPRAQAEEREPKAKADKSDAEIKLAKTAVAVEVGKAAPKIKAKAIAPKIEPAKAVPKVKTTKAAPKAELRKPAPQSQPVSAQALAADDLKQISGIGPRLEKVLNDRGIGSYAQIAGMTKAALKKIDDELGLEGRVIRDNWAAQAKALASGDA